MTQAVLKQEESLDMGEILSRVSLFEKISDEILQQFISQAQFRHVEKGKILYLQDDPADWFYVIVHGWVKLFRETLEGTEAIIDVLNDGHIFGENSVIENRCYSYAVEVIEDSQFIAIPTTILKNAIAKNNQLALNMLSSMSRYRLQQHREIEHLNVQNAPQRIGCFLLRLCSADVQESTTLQLPYDKTLIAGRLGMKPETFSRALAKLKDNTDIEVIGSTVHIRNINKLVKYTCNQCSSSFPCDDLK